MKKVLDKALKAKIAGIIKDEKVEDKAEGIVDALRGLQDASGIKICQNINAGDPAVIEVK
jgi:hypothetical protein